MILMTVTHPGRIASGERLLVELGRAKARSAPASYRPPSQRMSAGAAPAGCTGPWADFLNDPNNVLAPVGTPIPGPCQAAVNQTAPEVLPNILGSTPAPAAPSPLVAPGLGLGSLASSILAAFPGAPAGAAQTPQPAATTPGVNVLPPFQPINVVPSPQTQQPAPATTPSTVPTTPATTGPAQPASTVAASATSTTAGSIFTARNVAIGVAAVAGVWLLSEVL